MLVNVGEEEVGSRNNPPSQTCYILRSFSDREVSTREQMNSTIHTDTCSWLNPVLQVLRRWGFSVMQEKTCTQSLAKGKEFEKACHKHLKS